VEKITFSTKVISYLDDLIFILYKKDYFSYLENAEQYVSNIYDFIETEIPLNNYKITPESLSKYGDFYILYQSNARTTWYIFFSKKESVYLIKHIANNHSLDAKYINQL
jgi:hypothetical protein